MNCFIRLVPLVLGAQSIQMKNYILSQAMCERKLERMAYEIAEQNVDEKLLILAGIRENGEVIANLLKDLLAGIFPGKVDVISVSLDKRNPGEITLSKSLNFNDTIVILVDDVANSGKTMLYSLKPFLAFHPRKIQTLALVERTHKAYPVNTDYVGISLATTLQEHIFVEVKHGKLGGAWLE